MPRPFCAIALLFLAAGPAFASDWPHYMGPTRDGNWPETGVLETFPAGGPKKKWSFPVAGGYAGPAVANGVVYVTDKLLDKNEADPQDPFDVKTAVRGKERVWAIDEITGKERWRHEYPCEYKVSYGVGPRCTPTVAGGKVFTLGSMGHLFCLDAATGKKVWEKHFPTDYKAKTPTWGFCGHPLVYEKLLICLVGGEKALYVAFDVDTGKEMWAALAPPEPGAAGYAPPVLMTAGGTQQLIAYHPGGLSGLDPKTGKLFWTVKFKTQYEMCIMAPQKGGDIVFAGGVGNAFVAVKLDAEKPDAVELYRGTGKNALYPVNMTPVVDDGTIYGVDRAGQLRAVKLDTGERLWATFEPVVEQKHDEGFNGAGSGTAFLVKNGDRHFIFNEKGSLIIAKLTPAGYTEVDKTHLLPPTGTAFGRPVLWSHPAFANRTIYVRNDRELAAYDLTK